MWTMDTRGGVPKPNGNALRTGAKMLMGMGGRGKSASSSGMNDGNDGECTMKVY